MKQSRNEICKCGSGKKYKNCCENKRFQPDEKNKYIRWLISGAILFIGALAIMALVENFNYEGPEMETYDCGNPNCNIVHRRPVSQTK